MSTSAAPLKGFIDCRRTMPGIAGFGRRLDMSLFAGIGIVVVGIAAAITKTGIGVSYFFQPIGLLIVVVGTVGVMILTTPRTALQNSARCVLDLFFPQQNPSRKDLIEEIVSYSRVARTSGLFALEPVLDQVSHPFLRDALLLAMDVKDRSELQTALENSLRSIERQGEADAKTFEVAGGFAPTMGVLGTVVGLIDVLRQFTAISGVAYGMGAAFVSTIYGLSLANLVLLPASNRIRARVAETIETQELMVEGILCLFEGIHPRLMRHRLDCFLRETGPRGVRLATVVSSPLEG